MKRILVQLNSPLNAGVFLVADGKHYVAGAAGGRGLLDANVRNSHPLVVRGRKFGHLKVAVAPVLVWISGGCSGIVSVLISVRDTLLHLLVCCVSVPEPVRIRESSA